MEVKDPAARTIPGHPALSRSLTRSQAPKSKQRPSTRRRTTLATSSWSSSS